MASRFVSRIARPLADYLTLTVVEPFKIISEQCQNKSPRNPAKSKQSFSIARHIAKQREMTSPNTGGAFHVDSLREQYVRQTYVIPSSSEWLH